VDVTLDERNQVVIYDVLNERKEEELDFRDRVIDMSLGFGALVVTTNNQCMVYLQKEPPTWNPPHVEDLKEPPTLITQCPHHFALVDSVGIHICSYEGRNMCTIKFAGLRTEFLNHQTLTICKDTICMVDPTQPRQIRLFDAQSGRAMGNPIQHKLDVVRISLNQSASQDRKVAILDKNKDLYLTKALQPDRTEKLASMVDSFSWNDSTDMLVALIDQRLVTFLYPSVVFVDKDLLPMTQQAKQCADAGKYANIYSFVGSHVGIRKADGASLAMMTTPYAHLLYQHVEKGIWHWTTAFKYPLCRHFPSSVLYHSLIVILRQRSSSRHRTCEHERESSQWSCYCIQRD